MDSGKKSIYVVMADGHGESICTRCGVKGERTAGDGSLAGEIGLVGKMMQGSLITCRR